MFIVCSYLSGSIGIVRKNVTKDAVMVCIYIITHTIFFIIIAPVSHYRGTPRFWAFLGLFFFVGGDGWREGRTDCRRGGCMVVPGAVVSPGHTKRLSLLPCRAPHNSPCTLMRTWLRQMGLGAVALTCGSSFYIQHKTPDFEKPGACGIISLCY